MRMIIICKYLKVRRKTMSEKTTTKNQWIINQYRAIQQTLKPHLTISSLFIYLLTIGATVAISALSYAGAIALSFSYGTALSVFALTAIVCLQVNLEMIRDAISKLKKFTSNGHPILNSIMLVMSILAAISFSFSTLNAAVGLFSLTASILISITSSLAFLFISYELMQKTFDYIKNYKNYAFKFYNNLKIKHWSIKYLALLASVSLLSITGFLMVATAPTWWLETQLGAILLLSARSAIVIKFITAPFAIISNSLFAAINSMEAIMKFSDFGMRPSLNKNIKDNPKIQYSPVLKYQPIFLLNKLLINSNKLLINITEFTLFITHSLAHALMAGRTSFTTLAGTVVDFCADANFTIAKNCNHGHEPFDFFVMLTKVAVSLPLLPFEIATSMIVNKIISPQNSWYNCAVKSFKGSFNFVSNYIESKKHDHNHDHGDENGAEVVATQANKQSPRSQANTTTSTSRIFNLYTRRTGKIAPGISVPPIQTSNLGSQFARPFPGK